MLNDLIRTGAGTSAVSDSQKRRESFLKKTVIAAKTGKYVAVDYSKSFALKSSFTRAGQRAQLKKQKVRRLLRMTVNIHVLYFGLNEFA